MPIDRKTVEHIAKLARIDLDEGELAYFSSQLSKIVAYIEKINQLESKDAPDTFSPHGQTNVYRDDKVVPFDNREGLIRIFPASEEGCIKIPRVLD